MGDRAAAGPARLTERDLAAMEERIGRGAAIGGPANNLAYRAVDPEVVALVAALRAAWAELTVSREDYDAAVADLAAAHAERDRLNASLLVALEGLDVAYERISALEAALAAPGAGEGGEA